MNGVEILPGGRLYSTIYRDVETNYLYKKQAHRRDCMYFVCHISSCTGTAAYKDDVFISNRRHNHDPDMRKINSYYVMNRCKERVGSENTPVKQIFNEEMSKFPNDTPNLDIKEVESSLSKYRKRTSTKPEDENTVAELLEKLKSSRYGKTSNNDKFFKDHQELPDGSVNIIFVSPGLVHLLLTPEVLYIDATNQTIPGPPAFAQFLVVYAADLGSLFPVVYVLMTHDTVDAFCAVFKYIQDMSPSWNPNNIITSFREDIQRAVQKVFGEHHAEILGDFHHFSQILRRKLDHPNYDLLNALKANEEPVSTIIKACFSLPLLPAERCIEGIQVLRHQADILLSNRVEFIQKISRLFDYIEDYWFNLVGIQSLFEKWKVCDWHLQVNTFNNMFLRCVYASVKTQNSIWNYIDKLIKCEDRERQRFIRALEGQRNHRNLCKGIMKERLTKSMLGKLQRNEIYIWQFLTELTELSYVNEELEALAGGSKDDSMVEASCLDDEENSSLVTVEINNFDGSCTVHDDNKRIRLENKPMQVMPAMPSTSANDYQNWNPHAARPPDHIELKPPCFTTSMKPDVKATKKKKKKPVVNGNGASNVPFSGNQTSNAALLSQHIHRQNEILSSLLTQTNALYASIQNQSPDWSLQNDLTIHKSLVESIVLRTQQIQNADAAAQQNQTNILTCRLCRQNKVQVLVRPCGHLCLCQPCWNNLKIVKPYCPTCQERVIEGVHAII